MPLDVRKTSGADKAVMARDGVGIAYGFLPAAFVDQLPLVLDQVRGKLRRSELARPGRFVLGCLPAELESLPRLFAGAAHHLLGTPNVALYSSRLLLKDAHWSGAVQLHQDMPYFHGGARKISAFVPLQPMRASDGGLRFIKGSHKYGMLERGVIELDKFASPQTPLQDLAPDVEPGDVIFMDFLTWHYSGPGSSERPLMQITFQPATDGSYCGLPGPTLLCGEWQTECFTEKGKGIKQDA